MVEGVEIEIKILEEYKALVHQKGNIDVTRSVKQCAFFIFDEGIFDALVDNTLLSDLRYINAWASFWHYTIIG